MRETHRQSLIGTFLEIVIFNPLVCFLYFLWYLNTRGNFLDADARVIRFL